MVLQDIIELRILLLPDLPEVARSQAPCNGKYFIILFVVERNVLPVANALYKLLMAHYYFELFADVKQPVGAEFVEFVYDSELVAAIDEIVVVFTHSGPSQ